MKIALLSPAGAMHRYNGSFGKALHYAPLTMTTLAALVPPELEAEVVIYDETVEAIPLDIDADLLGITAITGTSVRAYRYADYFRSRGIFTVLGGVHPSMLPEEAGEHADAVFVGVADDTWPQFLRDFAAKRPVQKFYRQNAEVSLAGRPFPRRELLKPKGYSTINTVEAVRGCTLPCTFCAYPAAFGSKLHTRPVQDVLREIETLPGKIVLFPDVNLLADRQYAIKLFTGMIPLKKWWFGLVTSSIGGDKEVIDIFRRSGCKGVLIGFESLSQGAQSFIKKGVNQVDNYDVLMKRLHDAGIAVNGCFAFGGDDDYLDVFERTVAMIIKLKIDLPRFSVLTPFPGTRLYKELLAQDRIFEHDYAMYDVEHVVFRPRNMTAEQLEEGLERAWRLTYQYSSIMKRLAYWKSILPIAIPANTAYRHYADKFALFTKEVMTDNSYIPQGEKL